MRMSMFVSLLHEEYFHCIVCGFHIVYFRDKFLSQRVLI